MAFELSGEHLIIKETIKDFLQKECSRETARELEKREEIPNNLWSQISDIGFFGLTVPEEYGGEGVNYLGGLITIEELAGISPSLALSFMCSAFTGGGVIVKMGDAQQKEKYLEKLARGELVFTSALAEEEKGLSIDTLKTSVKVEGNELVLNGAKCLVTLAEYANYFIVLANNVSSVENKNSVTLLIVEAGSAGIKINKMKKIGVKAAGAYEIIFKDVRVPEQNILGGKEKLNHGREQYKELLDIQNMCFAALQLGIARGAYEYARNHAKERVQFGQPIIKFDAIKEMLLELAVEIDACQLLVYRAGSLADLDKPFSRESGMAISYSLPLVKKAASQCIQICGGYGYALEYDAQRYLRDAFAVPINGQTSETVNERTADLVGL
jgi:alkylation response protein AidB-like acyl-CoA dehydrogenase